MLQSSDLPGVRERPSGHVGMVAGPVPPTWDVLAVDRHSPNRPSNPAGRNLRVAKPPMNNGGPPGVGQVEEPAAGANAP